MEKNDVKTCAKNLVGMVFLVFLVSCGTSGVGSGSGGMSASEEARYARAAAKAGPSPDIVVVVDAGQGMAHVSSPATEDQTFRVSAQDFDAFFELGPAYSMQLVGVEPLSQGGRLAGYRIRTVSPSLKGVDLRPGDVIVGIDGTLPPTPDAYLESWTHIRETRRGSLQVLRDGSAFELTWISE